MYQPQKWVGGSGYHCIMQAWLFTVLGCWQNWPQTSPFRKEKIKVTSITKAAKWQKKGEKSQLRRENGTANKHIQYSMVVDVVSPLVSGSVSPPVSRAKPEDILSSMQDCFLLLKPKWWRCWKVSLFFKSEIVLISVSHPVPLWPTLSYLCWGRGFLKQTVPATLIKSSVSLGISDAPAQLRSH